MQAAGQEELTVAGPGDPAGANQLTSDMNRALLFIFLVLIFPAFSQIGPRTWEDHLGINSCNSVTRNGTTVYASNYNGLIYFEEHELSIESLNKINGLSDIGVRLLRTNPYNKKVLVIYDNCNIDVIDQHRNIRNYPDIKLKTFNGKKIINEVTFDKHLAYLACGFGIVVFDTEAFEVKETYIIGPNASQLEVRQLALNDSLIFAATPAGMFRANRNTLLNNYVNWRYDTLYLPRGYFCGVQNISGTILGCYCPSNLDHADEGKDSIYTFRPSGWIKYPPMADTGHTIRSMGASYENLFSIADLTGLQVRDVTTGALKQHLASYNGVSDYGTYRDSYIGKNYSGNIAYWVADARFGLNRTYQFYDPWTKIVRNGMNRSTVGNIDIFKGKVAVSPSYIHVTGAGNYSREGVNMLRNGDWSYLKCDQEDGAEMQDVTSVLWDRQDTSVMWVASWYYGVVKYKNNQRVAVYTPSNTNMPEILPHEPRCSGLSMDATGNLWFANSNQKDYLSVIRKNGIYQNFAFDMSRGFTRKTFIDRNNYIWILHESGGLTVFRNDNFSTPVQNVNYRWLSNAIGGGNLQSNSVYSIAEDKDGRIWIGTGLGISVIYNPTSLFNGGDFDSQPIKIVQDGNVELLLGKEIVTTIRVDGANNKWCGTYAGGVYCFSPDGQTQLYHFTKENSPLYSNTVLEINYDEVTGDLFFATDRGLQSFRGTIVAGESKYEDVYAYPNPVRPNYQGTVLIRGLMDASIVKITDESGNMVWETKSSGGQVEWPVTTLSHSRVTSGVYLVYASTTDGQFRAITKILVVN
jgi:hypothetical protein